MQDHVVRVDVMKNTEWQNVNL